MTVPPSPSRKPDDEVVASIRANIVFEKMIVSVLTVAVAAGAAHLLIHLGARAASGTMTLGAVGAAIVAALGYAGIFFLAGFAASAAIGIPLFRHLERAKIRKSWPYVLAAFAVSVVILTIAGEAPGFDAPARTLHLIPGLAAALVFARKMRPFWRAAENAEAPPPAIPLQ